MPDNSKKRFINSRGAVQLESALLLLLGVAVAAGSAQYMGRRMAIALNGGGSQSSQSDTTIGQPAGFDDDGNGSDGSGS